MRAALSFPYLNVYLHEGSWPALETHWLSYVPSSDFRTAIEQALRLGQEHHVQGWVADDRLLGAVRPRDLQWVLEVVLTGIAELGVERFALLESHDTLNRLTIASMYQQAQPIFSFEIRRFDDLQQARAWATGTAD